MQETPHNIEVMQLYIKKAEEFISDKIKYANHETRLVAVYNLASAMYQSDHVLLKLWTWDDAFECATQLANIVTDTKTVKEIVDSITHTLDNLFIYTDGGKYDPQWWWRLLHRHGTTSTIKYDDIIIEVNYKDRITVSIFSTSNDGVKYTSIAYINLKDILDNEDFISRICINDKNANNNSRKSYTQVVVDTIANNALYWSSLKNHNDRSPIRISDLFITKNKNIE